MTEMIRRLRISIGGIVQGVGFRPYVFTLAHHYMLNGFVLNDASGVLIEAEGRKEDLDHFMETLMKEPPPNARILEMAGEDLPPEGYTSFVINESRSRGVEDGAGEKQVPTSQDLATCDDCLAELFDPEDRRYRYPFLNCTNCGPRYTIVKDVPYDRGRTTMQVFPMCDRCSREYHDPQDRRFHAQPTACPDCGPALDLLDGNGSPIECGDIVLKACEILKNGGILAVKGIGGFHLACNAEDDRAVRTLRAKKFREDKPFALMSPDIETVSKLCEVSETDKALLMSKARPIVIMKKRAGSSLSSHCAPGRKTLGIMLPYTPLHHLLMREGKMVLVMTSGNMSEEPIAYKDREALTRLCGIADGYLMHDREIHIRCDDSVTRIFRGREMILRRSRGYAPAPLILSAPLKRSVLACGAHLKNTFCLTRDDRIFLSHHIGDLENMETLGAFEEGIEHYRKLFDLHPDVIAYDLHPGYLSTRYALASRIETKIGVQHHHAHVVSCCAENDFFGKVIGVSWDGTGYGTDGQVWGGEFLIADPVRFIRAAHFVPVPLPGGERAIREPWRMGLSYLRHSFRNINCRWPIHRPDMSPIEPEAHQPLDENGTTATGPEDEAKAMDLAELFPGVDPIKFRGVSRVIEGGVNSPLTSSAGRIFDAVSSILGICLYANYEGQAAVELEMAADGQCDDIYPFEVREEGGTMLVDMRNMFRGLVHGVQRRMGKGALSSIFHNTMAHVVLAVCRLLRERYGPNKVALSGGVFQNILLLEKTVSLLSLEGFTVFTHHAVPPNDGGVCLGQAVIADAQLRERA